ncbi:MAG: SLC13 family permease [Balneolales bacterium]
MGLEAWAVLLIIIGCFVVLFSTRIPPDLVFMGGLGILIIGNVISPSQALVGFSNQGMLTVAALYVVASGLKETGAIRFVVTNLLGEPKNLLSAQSRLIGPVMGMSAILNNTPIVASFIPAMQDWADKYNFRVSKLMIPLSYAAILGGTCTLIGTSTNLLVHGMLIAEKDQALNIFEPAIVGIPIAVAGSIYLLTIGRKLLPGGEPEMKSETNTGEYVTQNGDIIHEKVVDDQGQSDGLLVKEAPPLLAKKTLLAKDLYLSTLLSKDKPTYERSWLSLLIVTVMILTAAFGLLSMFQAAILAAGLMMTTRCCTIKAARNSIDWPVLLVIAAALGIGNALQVTGAASIIAGSFIQMADSNPYMALAATYLATWILTEMITNNAAAVLIFPIAISIAASMDVSYMPFVMIIIFAASASFSTPIGYQTNMMVYGPGGYKFTDYVKVGLPLNLIAAVIALTLIPLIWRF